MEAITSDPSTIVGTEIIVANSVAVARVSLVIDNAVYEAVGQSRCDDLDPFSSEIAVLLAAGRAFRQLGRNMLKDGHQMVRENDALREANLERLAQAKKVSQARAKEYAKKSKVDKAKAKSVAKR